jgi:hypothetical protein
VSKSLLDLSSERRTLEEILERSGGDLSDPAIAAAWDANCVALLAKVDGYATFAQDLEAVAERYRNLAKAATAKAKAVEAAHARLMERALLAMGDKPELAGETWRLIRRVNPASVVVTDEAALKESCPEAVREKVETVIDKKAVKAALERGSAVRGAMLVQGERIEVRP